MEYKKFTSYNKEYAVQEFFAIIFIRNEKFLPPNFSSTSFQKNFVYP